MKSLPEGATSIRMGSAVLRPIKELDHFGLYRPVIIVRAGILGESSREQLDREIGPLAVYRRRGKGDPVPDNVGSLPGLMRTDNPKTGEPMEVILIWRPGQSGGEDF